MPEEREELRVTGPDTPFSLEEEREEERLRTQELEPVFDELDEWRRKSLSAPLRI